MLSQKGKVRIFMYNLLKRLKYRLCEQTCVAVIYSKKNTCFNFHSKQSSD